MVEGVKAIWTAPVASRQIHAFGWIFSIDILLKSQPFDNNLEAAFSRSPLAEA
jgi:hypothetical protein